MNPIFKLLKILNSDVSPWQISLGFVLGMCIGVIPLFSLANLLLLFILCLVRVNIAAFLLSFTLCSGVAWLLDQQMLMLGEAILNHQNLQSVWQLLYASEIWRLTHFNNTLMMGAWIISLALALPVFFMSRLLIIHYRESFMVWVNKTKLMRWVKMSKWYQRGVKAAGFAEELTS